MITGPLLALSALYATSISDNCVYEGIPLTADIVGEGIGTHYPLYAPRLGTICKWVTTDGGTYDVVYIEPLLTGAFYLGIAALLVGIALLLRPRRDVSKL